MTLVISFLGLTSLFCSKKKPESQEELNISNISGDNVCKWNTLTILKWTGIHKADLILANFQSTVCLYKYMYMS